MKYEAKKTWHVVECGEHSNDLRAALQGIENQGGEVFAVHQSSILAYGAFGYKIIYYTTVEQSVIKGFEV